jgi:hypothetical protein
MKRFVVLLAVLTIVSLACNLPRFGQTASGGQPSESGVSESEANGGEEVQPEPTQVVEPDGSETAEPSSEPTTAPQEPQPTMPASGALDPNPPAQPVRLVFIHHSSGENWLRDDHGSLGIALMKNNYFVSDTNYDWGPNDPDLGGPIGSYTDIGNWYNWFLGPRRDGVLSALFSESNQHSEYTRLENNPGSENEIVMFKSCFPNSALRGSPEDAPVRGESNPLRGLDSSNDVHSVGNIKGLYLDLLDYFRTRPDKLFILVTAPPLHSSATDAAQAANARALNRWLVQDWLKDYPLHNVAVFDFYNVLTSNGGNINKNDAASEKGNHIRWKDGEIQYVTDQGKNTNAYATADDGHATPAGNQKATQEFVPLLNIWYHEWKNGE